MLCLSHGKYSWMATSPQSHRNDAGVVTSAFNGWQAVKIGSQVGWVSGEYSEITTE